MSGFFLRPKDTNLDKANNHINAETVLPAQPSENAVDNEYIPASGFDSDTDGLSGAVHHRDPKRREAEPGAPLPSGNWRGSVSKTTKSGFGKGTRAGRTGVRRG